MSEFEIPQPHVQAPMTHGHGIHKAHPPPETVVGVEGEAKRNIRRRGGGKKSQKHSTKSAVKIDDGSGYVEPGGALDEYDPNYDSEDDEGAYIPADSPKRDRYTTKPYATKELMTLSHFKRRIHPMIELYFLNGEIDDIRRSLLELDEPQFSYEFVKRAVTMSMDHGDRERELVSKLLSELYPDVLSISVIGKGFERLFEIMDELVKDAPMARDVTSAFIARCVVDDILPPSFLSDIVVCSLGGDIVDHAKRMLTREHMGGRLERVWGPGDGRPVSEMKVDVDLLLGEYLMSRDVTEACKCVKELNSPHFYHEVVKRAIICVLDKTLEEREIMHKLLIQLFREGIISSMQMKMGYQLVEQRLSDIILDIPSARSLFETMSAWATTDGLITTEES
jgi:programmed cell death protein 4